MIQPRRFGLARRAEPSQTRDLAGPMRKTSLIAPFALASFAVGCGSTSVVPPDDAAAASQPDATAPVDDAATPSGCVPGRTDQGVCGKCGSRVRVCNANFRWSDWSACTGETGACTPGESASETCDDGRTRKRTCSDACEWGAFGACEGEAACTAGVTEESACGKCGKRVRVCSADRKWSDWSACTGEGVCAAGTQGEEACGVGGKRVRTCSSTCTWGAFGSCVGESRPCSSGATEELACGNCGKQIRVCSNDGKWSDWSACNGTGVCAPGATESEACGVGGTRRRTCSDACTWSAFGTCSGSATTGDGELWVATTPRVAKTMVAITLEKIRTSDGSVIETRPLPTGSAVTRPITVNADDSWQGALSRGGDGRIYLAGYGVAAGTASPPSTSTPRTIARVGGTQVDVSLQLTPSSNFAPTGVVSFDPNVVYAYGPNGILRASYVTAGSTSIASLDTGGLAFFRGQLYAAFVETNALTVRTWSSGPPTSATTGDLVFQETVSSGFPLPLPSANTLPYALAVLGPSSGAPDTILVAATVGASLLPGTPPTVTGLQVWTRSGTSWSRVRTLSAEVATSESPTHLAAIRRSDGSVGAYMVVSSGSTARIVAYDDVIGAAPTSRVLKTATSNELYRGVAFASP
jgi:hypothetical protein